MAKLTENGKLELRLVPPITQKLLAENDEFQKQIRRSLNTSDVHPQIMLRARAILQAEEVKKLMLGFFADRRKAKKSGNAEKVLELEAQIARLGDKLAKLLFDAGEFQLALKATRGKALRQKIREYIAAAEIDDEQHCGHQKWISFNGELHPNYFRERDIFSHKHNAVVSVVRCNECGFRNIRPLPEDLAEMSRIRAEARQKEKGK